MGEAKRKREAAARAQTRDALGLPEHDTPPDCLPRPSSAVEALSAIERSVSELVDHMEAPSGRGEYWAEARHKIQAQARVQIQIWIVQPAREFLWDSVDVAITDVAERDGLLGKLVDNGLVESAAPADKLVSVIDARRTCPLFEMHPQRFCTLHPMGLFVRNYEAAPPFTHRAMEAFTEAYRRTSNAQLHSERLRIKVRRPSRQSQQVISLATFVHDFQRHGRNIFRFPARLIELFHRTDVDGIPLDELKLPYDGFYMYFGPQNELAVDGWAPDGAYVSQIGRPGDRVIQFAMTFAPDESIVYDHPGEYPEPVYIQAITEEQLKIGIGEAVDLVYSAKVAELRHQMEHGSRPETLAAAQRNAPPGVSSSMAFRRTQRRSLNSSVVVTQSGTRFSGCS